MMCRPAALTDQVDAPARASDAAGRQRLGRHAADPPAAGRGGRHGRRILAVATPALEHQCHGSAIFRRQLKTAGRRHARAPDFANDAGKAAMPQPLLEHGKSLLIPAAVGIDQLVGRQPRLSQSGSEQVAAAADPQHCSTVAAGSRGNSGNEQSRCGIVVKATGDAAAFMERRYRQSLPSQPPVNLRNAKCKALNRRVAAAGLDCPHLFAKRIEARN